MITADMSASGSDKISSGNNKLTVVSSLAGPITLMAASEKPRK